MIKVLWITYNPLPDFMEKIKGKPLFGSSWNAPLALGLSQSGGVHLGVVTIVNKGEYQCIEAKGITQYTIPASKSGKYTEELSDETVSYYQQVIDDFQPELIHIHGTEKSFGLIAERKINNVPAIVSIQGILNSYYPFLLGGLETETLKKYASLKNRLGRGGVLNQRKMYAQYLPIEKRIIESVNYFFCRTNWDHAQVTMLNSKAEIFKGEELLRTPFYAKEWSLDKCVRHSVFISSGNTPVKGLHTIIRAVAILKRDFPDIKIMVPISESRIFQTNKYKSNDYDIFLSSLINKFNLESNICCLGHLDAEQMAITFEKSHVFVLPSSVENSPNSLGEAMMVGTPAVVSPVGGVPDIVKNGESSLYAPVGDVAVWAAQIKTIFQDDELAYKLSQNAKSTALIRHNVDATVNEYIQAYKEITKKRTGKNE